MLLIGYLYGITSERKLVETCAVGVARPPSMLFYACGSSE
jgi:hypothetical protein